MSISSEDIPKLVDERPGGQILKREEESHEDADADDDHDGREQDVAFRPADALAFFHDFFRVFDGVHGSSLLAFLVKRMPFAGRAILVEGETIGTILPFQHRVIATQAFRANQKNFLATHFIFNFKPTNHSGNPQACQRFYHLLP